MQNDADIILRYHESVGKHHRVLEAVFEKRANIAWSDIESMLLYYVRKSRKVAARACESRSMASAPCSIARTRKKRPTVAPLLSLRRFLTEAGIGIERKS